MKQTDNKQQPEQSPTPQEVEKIIRDTHAKMVPPVQGDIVQDQMGDYFSYFRNNRITLTGTSAGEYLEKEDFYKYGKWVVDTCLPLVRENKQQAERIKYLEDLIREYTMKMKVNLSGGKVDEFLKENASQPENDLPETLFTHSKND